MQTAPDAVNGFFAWLWRASWQASVIVVLVLLVQGLLRRQLTPSLAAEFPEEDV